MILADADRLASADLWVSLGAYATALLAVIGVAAWLRRALKAEVDEEVSRVAAAAITAEVTAQAEPLRAAVLGNGRRALREEVAALTAQQAAQDERMTAMMDSVEGVSARLDTLRTEYMRFLQGHFGGGA